MHAGDLKPSVSILLICYNHAAWVLDALESVASQVGVSFEVVAIDDASKDNSAEVLRNWLGAHPDIAAQLVVHSENQGLCPTLNEAISLARGQYVSFLAADDAWQSERKLKAQVALLEADESLGGVFSDADVIDETGRVTRRGLIAQFIPTGDVPSGDIFLPLLSASFLPASTVMLRRSVVDATGPFDASSKAEDWDYWLRVASRYQLAYDRECHGLYRVVSSSLSRTLSPEILYEAQLRTLRRWVGRSDAVNAAVRHRFASASLRLMRYNRTAARAYIAEAARADRGAFWTAVRVAAALPYPAAAVEGIARANAAFRRVRLRLRPE